jgi:hypothetical protein
VRRKVLPLSGAGRGVCFQYSYEQVRLALHIVPQCRLNLFREPYAPCRSIRLQTLASLMVLILAKRANLGFVHVPRKLTCEIRTLRVVLTDTKVSSIPSSNCFAFILVV